MKIKFTIRNDNGKQEQVEIDTDKYAEVTASVEDEERFMKSRTMRIEKKHNRHTSEKEINIWLG